MKFIRFTFIKQFTLLLMGVNHLLNLLQDFM